MVWQEVIENSNVWVYEYDANGYKANAFAFALDGNHLAIISPPIGLSDADFAAIDTKALPAMPSVTKCTTTGLTVLNRCHIPVSLIRYASQV